MELARARAQGAGLRCETLTRAWPCRAESGAKREDALPAEFKAAGLIVVVGSMIFPMPPFKDAETG